MNRGYNIVGELIVFSQKLQSTAAILGDEIGFTDKEQDVLHNALDIIKQHDKKIMKN